MSYITRFIPESNPKRLEVLTTAKEKKTVWHLPIIFFRQALLRA